MIFIDKQQNIADGEGYTRDYLEDSFDEGAHTFLPSLKEEESFNCFRNHLYVSHTPHADADFKSLLLREQQGRCCYCMRRISADVQDGNIEHLVPKKSQVAVFPYYARYSELLNFHVCHSETFENKNYPDKRTVARQAKLPHMVAYENLVVSCMDEHHCNSARGNETIPPLPIIREIESKYFYSPAGMIVTEDADREYEKSIGVLNLNFALLVQIRLLWKKVTASAFNLAQVMGITAVADKQAFLCTVFGKQSFSDLALKWQNFAPDSEDGSTYYWDLFVKYDWFYDYYKHHDKSGNRV